MVAFCHRTSRATGRSELFRLSLLSGVVKREARQYTSRGRPTNGIVATRTVVAVGAGSQRTTTVVATDTPTIAAAATDRPTADDVVDLSALGVRACVSESECAVVVVRAIRPISPPPFDPLFADDDTRLNGKLEQRCPLRFHMSSVFENRQARSAHLRRTRPKIQFAAKDPRLFADKDKVF